MKLSITNRPIAEQAAVKNTRERVFQHYGRLPYKELAETVTHSTGRPTTQQMVYHVLNHRCATDWLRQALSELMGVPENLLFLGSTLTSNKEFNETETRRANEKKRTAA